MAKKDIKSPIAFMYSQYTDAFTWRQKTKRNTHFAAKFQNQQLPLVQHLFKVSIRPPGHENTAAALQRATAWEHMLQSILWRHAKSNIPPGQAHIILPLSSKGREE